MRQNPRWILLSEVRSAEAVMAVRDSISSGHNILSTIHADKAESIPSRLYSLLESSIDMDQFLRSIHRYVQLGVHIKGYYSPELQRFKREVAEVVEFYVTEENKAEYKILYKRTPDGNTIINNPSKYLLGYLESQGVIMEPDILVKQEFHAPVDNKDNNTSTNNNLQNNSVVNRTVNNGSNVSTNAIPNNNVSATAVNNGVISNRNVASVSQMQSKQIVGNVSSNLLQGNVVANQNVARNVQTPLVNQQNMSYNITNNSG